MVDINCACLIHGDKYSYEYVNKLYSQLSRAFKQPVKLHVFTESEREVKPPYVKHSLDEWGLDAGKQSWWYKMQMFGRQHFEGPVFYFDLDVVITGSLEHLTTLPLDYFWSIQDFKYLWRPSSTTMNSSVMIWDAAKFWYVLDEFDLKKACSLHRGDQEYLSSIIKPPLLKFIPQNQVMSWRWQAVAGGYDFVHRRHRCPEMPAYVPEDVRLLIFHGDPKPHEIDDHVVRDNWR